MFAKVFLEDLPKQESHYCRSSSLKLYLEPVFGTFAKLFSVYKETCSSEDQRTVSCTSLKSAFDSLNLSLTIPKKDLCNTCELFKVNEIPAEDFKKHQMKKDRARSEKLFDKSMFEKHGYHVLTVDLQGVKQAPMFNANCIYFKSKLNVYNYTIFDIGSHDVRCYFWNETEGGLVASVFATCLIDY
ncbi:unnamed protein product, partial [Allacma fusca]